MKRRKKHFKARNECINNDIVYTIIASLRSFNATVDYYCIKYKVTVTQPTTPFFIFKNPVYDFVSDSNKQVINVYL